MPDEPDESPNPDSDVARSNADSGAKTCLFSAVVLFGLLIIGAFFIIRQFRPELPPQLTRTSFDAAWTQWDENEPPDYEIQIKVVGPRSALYDVKVENGTVVSATRNDVALPEVPRTMRTWSVPGMFDTMEHDVMRIEKPGRKELELRATFDPQHGYPSKYYRDDLSNNFKMRWTVERFQIGKNDSASDSANSSESEPVDAAEMTTAP